jgi:hypothetical protein
MSLDRYGPPTVEDDSFTNPQEMKQLQLKVNKKLFKSAVVSSTHKDAKAHQNE